MYFEVKKKLTKLQVFRFIYILIFIKNVWLLLL